MGRRLVVSSLCAYRSQTHSRHHTVYGWQESNPKVSHLIKPNFTTMSPAMHRGSGKCSRCSHWRFRLDGSGFEPQWRRNCLVPSPFHPGQGEHRAPCSINTGGKAAGAWRWPPPPPCAEVKKEKNYTPPPPPPSRACMTCYRQTFTFTLIFIFTNSAPSYQNCSRKTP